MPGTIRAASHRATPFNNTCRMRRISSSFPGAQLPRRLDHLALVGEAEPPQAVIPFEPRRPGHFGAVVIGGVAALVGQQVVVHALVDPHAALREPVLDPRQRRDHPPGDAGLLARLAYRGLLGALAGLDVPLGELPAPAFAGRDEQDLRVAHHQSSRRVVVLDGIMGRGAGSSRHRLVGYGAAARAGGPLSLPRTRFCQARGDSRPRTEDRKSTRLNSSHSQISYAVFCLKKKTKTTS